MFRPNTSCVVLRKAAQDIYGLFTFVAGVEVACAVVSYDMATHKTSVRADSSGSRGRSEELQGVSRFLFLPNVALSKGDRIQKDGYDLEIIEIHPRRAVQGFLDHNEVDMRAYTE